jgi:hypothetical protein
MNGAQDDNVAAVETHNAVYISVNDTKDNAVTAAGR